MSLHFGYRVWNHVHQWAHGSGIRCFLVSPYCPLLVLWWFTCARGEAWKRSHSIITDFAKFSQLTRSITPFSFIPLILLLTVLKKQIPQTQVYEIIPPSLRALPILKEVFGGEREERCQDNIQNQIQSWYQNYDMEITKNTASPCTVGNYPLLLHWSPSQLFWSICVWRNTGFHNLIRDINVNIWNQWRNPWLVTMIRKTNHYFAVILTMFYYYFFLSFTYWLWTNIYHQLYWRSINPGQFLYFWQTTQGSS